MRHIRQAEERDAGRIAEILVFNYRLNFYPILKNDAFYFDEIQVMSVAEKYLADKGTLRNVYVYDDGTVKGVLQISGREVQKLFVEPALQGCGIGEKLLRYAVENCRADFLWALEKNERAIKFYQRNGFHQTSGKNLRRARRSIWFTWNAELRIMDMHKGSLLTAGGPFPHAL